MPDYTLFNQRNGDAFIMSFKNDDQLKHFLMSNKNFKIVGKSEAYLPTRHVRMKSEKGQSNDRS